MKKVNYQSEYLKNKEEDSEKSLIDEYAKLYIKQNMILDLIKARRLKNNES